MPPICQYHSTNVPNPSSHSCCSYQKDKWVRPGNLLTKWWSFGKSSQPSKGLCSYPFPASAGHIGLFLFSATSPQLVQRVLNREPCSSMTFCDPALWCKPSIFCVISDSFLPVSSKFLSNFANATWAYKKKMMTCIPFHYNILLISNVLYTNNAGTAAFLPLIWNSKCCDIHYTLQ